MKTIINKDWYYDRKKRIEEQAVFNKKGWKV